jgi:plastocyanin
MLIVLALAGALFAGCGGDDDEPETAATPEPTAESTPADDGGSSSSAGGQSVDVSAPESGALVFDPKEITVKSGEVTFNFSNPSGVPHALDIEGVDGGEGETVQGDDAPPLTVNLEPGEYEYYCPVGGHRAAGMTGTLTVE